MMSRSRTALLFTVLAPLSAVAPFLLPIGCSPEVQAAAPTAAKAESKAAIADAPLAAYQIELLDIAFKAASAFPSKAQLKNRSRIQATVVDASFELDQPRRALAQVEQIDNWRRGVGYADFAFYCAKHGDGSEVQHFLDLADKLAKDLEASTRDEDSTAQGWQRDRIRSKIACTYLQLGRAEDAARYEQGLADSEIGRVAALRATQLADDAFDKQLAALDVAVATGNFDQLRGAIESYAQFFARFYSDLQRRAQLEGKIAAAYAKLPIQVRVESLGALTLTALDHEDPAKALELVANAQQLVDGAQWTAESGIPMRARLAGLRHRAGGQQEARKDLDSGLALYDAQRGEIVDIYRAGVLRPLAEAYQSMGDQAASLKLYKRAIEEGAVNPNSRPRAEDLSATCCSMAIGGVEPDAELRARILHILGGLGDPW